MSLSLVPLLMVDEAVPARARAALLAASNASLADRRQHLETAAHSLWAEAHLECADALELVGLDRAR